jgi:hypothetical protein
LHVSTDPPCPAPWTGLELDVRTVVRRRVLEIFGVARLDVFNIGRGHDEHRPVADRSDRLHRIGQAEVLAGPQQPPEED